MWILFLSFVQNVAFSLTSRSRNRDNMTYRVITSLASNGIWFWTMRELVVMQMGASAIIPYMIGTTAGSLAGVRLAMTIEKHLGAKSDGHIKEPKP